MEGYVSIIVIFYNEALFSKKAIYTRGVWDLGYKCASYFLHGQAK